MNRISPPRWVAKTFRGHTQYQRICLVSGLLIDHMRDHSYARPDDLAEIDASIAPLIVALNDLGHRTMFCCSGLPEDHRDAPEWDPYWGYILFAAPVPVELCPKGVVVSWEDSHWRFAYDANACRAQWDELAARLGVSPHLTETLVVC